MVSFIGLFHQKRPIILRSLLIVATPYRSKAAAVLHCVAVWCNMLRCFAVCCSVLQCVAV